MFNFSAVKNLEEISSFCVCVHWDLLTMDLLFVWEAKENYGECYSKHFCFVFFTVCKTSEKNIKRRSKIHINLVWKQIFPFLCAFSVSRAHSNPCLKSWAHRGKVTEHFCGEMAPLKGTHTPRRPCCSQCDYTAALAAVWPSVLKPLCQTVGCII